MTSAPGGSSGKDQVPWLQRPWHPATALIGLFILSVGAVWLAWDEVSVAGNADESREAWLLFGISYLGGIMLGALLHWMSRGLKGTGTNYLALFQTIGFLLAGALLIWKSFASPRQLVVVYAILGGAVFFATAWFAWFLLVRKEGGRAGTRSD